MRLKKLTDNIYYDPHQPEVDRPMLAYLKGSRMSLAIDAGYSDNHVNDFYEHLNQSGLKKPDLQRLPIGTMTTHLECTRFKARV